MRIDGLAWDREEKVLACNYLEANPEELKSYLIRQRKLSKFYLMDGIQEAVIQKVLYNKPYIFKHTYDD
jgi:hypothetical protein